MEEIIKSLIKREKEMDDPKSWSCSCNKLKKGMDIYCYRHKKESPYKTTNERIKVRLKYEKDPLMIERLKASLKFDEKLRKRIKDLKEVNN